MTKITNQSGVVATAAGALVAVGLLMPMAVVEAGPAGAAFPGKNGRIAYASYDAPFPKGDSEIYTIRADGSGKRQLTNNDTDEFDLSYSPDGKRIVYEGFEGSLIKEQNVDDASTNIYTIKAGGGGSLNLTKSPKNASIWNAWPRYSPDGQKIAYKGDDGKIYTINARGGGGKSRVTNVFAFDLSWGIRP